MTMTSASQVNPAERILMGPGPSTVPHRILRALSAPTLGHLDPQYLAIMDETCELLRQIFRTQNKLTFPVSGTGMAGMECIAVNLLERGDDSAPGGKGGLRRQCARRGDCWRLHQHGHKGARGRRGRHARDCRSSKLIRNSSQPAVEIGVSPFQKGC